MKKEKKGFFKKYIDYEMKYWKDTADVYKEEAANFKKLKQIYSKENIKKAWKENRKFERGAVDISQEQYIEDIHTTALSVMMIMLVFSAFFSVFSINIAKGVSMSPTIEDGNIVICSRNVEDIKKGDIVVVKTNKKMSDTQSYVVKRISEITDTNVFLLGDNEEHSKDSRTYGYVNRNLIVGKVINYD